MLRALLDANVLVAALLTPGGWPWRLVQAWHSNRFALITSVALLTELQTVLDRPDIRTRVRNATAVDELLASIRGRAVLTVPDERQTAASHESDNRVLEAGVAGQADYIVTGDGDLLDLDPFRGIRIVTPTNFATVLGL